MSASVFPAYVGMSPTWPTPTTNRESVPRIRGDEPRELDAKHLYSMCSPHTWG